MYTQRRKSCYKNIYRIIILASKLAVFFSLSVTDNSLLEEKEAEKGETEDGNVKVEHLEKHF